MVIKIISPTKAYISGSRASKSSSGLWADHMEADVVISGNNVTEKGTAGSSRPTAPPSTLPSK